MSIDGRAIVFSGRLASGNRISDFKARPVCLITRAVHGNQATQSLHLDNRFVPVNLAHPHARAIPISGDGGGAMGVRAEGLAVRKRCPVKGNFWLAAFVVGGRFPAMDCHVENLKEKIDAYLSVPPLNQTRWVECKGSRCLGILDPSGKWRCFATGEELPDIVKIHCD
jgi:hypothetical protein